MQINRILSLFLLPFLLILTLLAGCNTSRNVMDGTKNVYRSTKKTVKKITPGKSNLKMRIMVLPFIDHMKIQSGMAEEATNSFIQMLRKSDDVLVFEAQRDVALPGTEDFQQFEFGVVTNPDIAKKAEEMGMNGFITGILNPIETTTKRSGIWPFRKNYKIFDISLVINAVDVVSGTLFLTHLESEKTSVLLEDIEDIGGEYEKTILKDFFPNAFARIIKRQSYVVADTLANKRWTGRILEIDKDMIKIGAGSDVGVRPGHRFEVFAEGESISSGRGTAIDLMGIKIGEIETLEVMEKNSLAFMLSGEEFKVGQLIRFNP